MAECHPVGFQWVMEAKARGATVIHVDPRFTRTSAVADLHVPLRAGSDIVFLGAIINYVLANEKYFRDYVVTYTNAAALVTSISRAPARTAGIRNAPWIRPSKTQCSAATPATPRFSCRCRWQTVDPARS